MKAQKYLLENFNYKTLNDKRKLEKVELIDFNIGELNYIENTRNAVKLTEDLEYIFIRFDGIDTHISPHTTNIKLKDIQEKILNKLDYDLEFADDRVKLVNELLEKNQWIYDLISSKKMIQKEVKKKDSLLAEDQRYDKLIDNISTYINHAKFKNQEDKLKYDELIEKKKNLTKKKYLTSSERDLLFKINDVLSQYRNRLHPDDLKNHYNEEEYEEKENKLNNEDVVDLSKSRDIVRKRYKNKQKFDITFWNRMGYTIEQKAFRNELINNYEQAIMFLEDYLGYNQTLEERSKIQQNLLQQFKKQSKIIEINGKSIILTPKRRLKLFNDMYAKLKSDYKTSLEKLTDQIKFKRLDKTNTEYNWNQDTWYINENGETVEISKNILSFANPNKYKGLLLNYYELKDKYKDRMNDDMWAILLDFENLMQQIKLSKLEKEICEKLMSCGDLREVEKYIRNKYPYINKRKFYRYIDTYIPNKFKKIYIKLIDEWLYTDKLIGEWKQCSRCGEFKLISNDRYFYKKSDNSDGFHNVCIECMKKS